MSYIYDALGNISSATVNGSQTNYLIDPAGLAQVVGEYNGTGNLIAHYAYGIGLTSRVDVGGQAAYYDFDAIGSTVGVSGTTGNYVNIYRYLPSGDTLTSTGIFPNPFQFIGQFGVMTYNTSLDFMRARFYMPETGSFTSPDPMKLNPGQMTTYTYAANCPLQQVDPEGENPYVVAAVVIGTVAIFPEVYVAVQLGEIFFASSVGFSVLVTAAELAPWVGAGLPLLLGGTGGAPATEAQFFVLLAQEIYDAVEELTPDLPWFLYESTGMYPYPKVRNVELIGSFSGIPPIPSGITHGQAFTLVLASDDPNSIAGPSGFGANGFVLPDQTLPYTIHFENLASAPVPAQTVVVTQQLDPNLDFTTFQLGDCGFGSVTVPIPSGRTFYNTRLDLRTTYGFFVDVTAGINFLTGLVTWTFTSIDPGTLDLLSNPLAGFLPPDTSPPQGEGFVSYYIRPKASDATGTRINAKATVIFDTNAPLDTARIFNTIDAGPPASSVNPLPAVINSQTFTASWSGADDPGGSGIAFFDVFVSTDNGPFMPFLLGTTQTSASFTGVFGHSYGFYSVATDNVGHRQATPTASQASTQLVFQTITPTATTVNATSGSSTYGQMVTFTAVVTAGGNPVTAGTVTFQEGNLILANAVPLDSSGHASFMISSLSVATSPHTITAYYSGTPSFSTSSGSTTLAVKAAPLTVTANNATKVYGQANPAFTVSYSGFVNGESTSSLTGTLGFSTPATASSPVGTYAVVPSGLTSSNYTITFVNGTLTITVAPLAVTADNKTKVYGQLNPAFTVSYSGFVNGDTPSSLGGSPSFSTLATASSPVGMYAISPSGLTSTNYAITFVNGSLTVIPAPLTASGINFQATAGAPFSGTVATFQNADPFGSVNSYTATITWGDGNSSAGTIIDQGSGVFAVTGTNTYADPNGYTVQVRIQHKLGYTTSPTTNGTATISSLGLSVQSGQAAGIGFWHNGNGQALIDSFNGGPNATGLANWLALTFPNLYGANAGANNLFGKSNLQVAAFYLTQFSLHGPKVEAEVLATALNVYATTLSLGGTAASAYGFTVSATGLGARSFNVGADGAAVGVANNTSLNVFEMLKAVNQRAVGGVLYNGNATFRQQATDLFDAINQAGGI